MAVSNIKSYYRKMTEDRNRIYQGDIFESFQLANVYDSKEGTTFIQYPYVVVVSQDCDLERDFAHRNNLIYDRETNGLIKGTPKDQDKYLDHIILLPAFLKDSLFTGEHIGGSQRQQIAKSDHRREITNLNNKRYHYFQDDDLLGLPELVIDFKLYFTATRDYLYNEYHNNDEYVCSIEEIFRESLSTRFCSYLSRIALPVI